MPKFDSCKGQESCRVMNLAQFVAPDLKTKCTDDLANFFVQYQCSQKPEILEKKRQDGAVIAGTSIFSALVFMVSIFYLR